ncbi:MAG: ABC transporter permease, partial [Actinobacteria bacterium]|nr:ABC transporter permease [Actinomycetota bacterium]
MIRRKKNETSESLVASGENAIANKEVEGLSQSQIVFRRFLRHRAAVFSVFFLFSIMILVFSAVDSQFGPIRTNGWWKWSP